MELDYKALNLKRGSIKGRVTKFINQVDELKGKKLSPIEVNVLTQRLAKLEALFLEFDGVQGQIEMIDAKNLSSELDAREAIEQAFHSSIAKAQEIISLSSTTKKSSLDPSSSFATADEDDHEVIGFRLPIIKIKNFDGTYYKWMELRDTFSSLIHNNSKIKNIHKFHYLISYLEGEPARVISNLEVSDVNYNEAWTLLCDRYNNIRQLVYNHLKSLFNIEPIRESDKSLRFLIDHITKNLRALNTLKQPTDHWDTLIIYMVSAKLDSATRVKWEEYIHTNVSDNEMPNLDDFKIFLKGRADVLESVSRSKQDRSPIIKPFSSNTHGKQSTTSHSKSFITAERGEPSTQTAKNCIVCKGDHRIYDCTQFKSKSIDDRISLVSDLKLCKNCLRIGHNQHACKIPGSCRICKRRYNTYLCKANESKIDTLNNEQTSMSAITTSETLLCTALVDIINPLTNKTITIKALLDNGSQCSFITHNVKEQLNLISPSSNIQYITGIGETALKLNTERCSVRIQPKKSSLAL